MIDRSGIGVTPSRTDSLFASRELGHPETKARLPTVSITRSHLRHAIVALVCVCAAMGLVYCPYLLDLPLTHLVNRGVHKSPALNVAFYDLDEFAIFSGGAFLALLWACWFSAEPREEEEVRSRLLAGILVCIPAGVLSRFLQHRLHSHPRPFFDPALGFHPVFSSSVQRLNTWNSFPSDHATVFAGLVTAICLVRADLRKFVIPWLIVVEFARLYLGAHYATDLLGGAALGALMVFLAQAPWIVTRCQRLAAAAKVRPFVFYSIAFW